ncbi:hypothetical protein [Burkholderia plantarii]|uniref:hypothetical protein n=1 Tax=Burkholderia plantarii TaxID=41899 RepID=UPI000B1869AB|nr:hypothetical protein [Burkholderia plantarii]
MPVPRRTTPSEPPARHAPVTAHRWLAAALLATGAAAIALLVVHRVVGFRAGTHGRRGILLLVVVGSYGPAAAVLPANLPNVIMAGIPERSPGTRLGFFEYLLRFFPAGAMVRGAVLVYAARRLFPDQARAGRVPATPFPAPDRREWHAAAPLAITLGFWLTDSLHHVAPCRVGLGFVSVYFATSPPARFRRFVAALKLDLLAFVAAIIGLAALVDRDSIHAPSACSPPTRCAIARCSRIPR